ncbi:MAG: acyl-CoA desaturase [Bacteroidota bacterium]
MTAKTDFRAIKFSKDTDTDFIRTLRKRVGAYFRTNKISRHANASMKVKTVCMISIYLAPYFLMMTGVVTNFWAILGLWLVMGVGMAGIGLSIMHDANHGAYSSNKNVNKYLGFLLDFVGGSAYNWKIQHNLLHHSFTNVDGLDEDISPRGVLRFSPHQEHRQMHRFQHVYAWFLYGLMTFTWVVGKDFNRFFRYKSMGIGKEEKGANSHSAVFTRMLIAKLFYYTYIIVLPILVLPVSWGWVLFFFFVMHFVSGFILGIIFQPAHVVPQTEYPLPDDKGKMENHWAIHQMLTTTNFAPTNPIIGWYAGGLNYQIEHHLFPTICHVHYKELSKIVRQTAEEFGIPYHSEPTFRGAIINHGKMLWSLGNPS